MNIDAFPYQKWKLINNQNLISYLNHSDFLVITFESWYLFRTTEKQLRTATGKDTISRIDTCEKIIPLY